MTNTYVSKTVKEHSSGNEYKPLKLKSGGRERVKQPDSDTHPTLSKTRDGIQLDEHVNREAEKPPS